MTDFSFPTSGDPDEDLRIADQYRLHSERMAKNICPNGCGLMTWIDAHNRECPTCRFAGFSTRQYDMDGGTA